MRFPAPLVPLAALGLAFVPASQGKLAWGPAEGLVLERSFSSDATWTATHMTQRVAGQDLDVPPPDIDLVLERDVVLLDALEEVAAERPRRLLRTFDVAEGRTDLALQIGDQSLDLAVSVGSPYVDARATFAWDADEEEHSVEVEGGPVDAARGLVEDASLRGLLSAREVAEGDTWKLPAERLAALLQPGGDLRFAPEVLPELPPGDVDAADLVVASLLWPGVGVEGLEGTLEVTWTGTVEEDGRPHAVLELVLTADRRADLSERAARRVEDLDVETPRRDLVVTVEGELTGEGRALWDLGGGHLRRLRLDTTDELTLRQAWVQSMGEDVDCELVLEMEGTSVFELEVGRP